MKDREEDPQSWRVWPAVRMAPGPHPKPSAEALAELGERMDRAARPALWAGTGEPEGTCNCQEPYGVPGGQCRNCGYTLVTGQFTENNDQETRMPEMTEAQAVTRSTGISVPGWHGPLPGGGYRGATAELDAIVTKAAAALAAAYGQDVEIRFNSDRESGGAWLKTPDGGNAEVGIAASVVTAYARSRWLRSAERYEHEAATGKSVFGKGPGGQMTTAQIGGCREMAAWDRDLLARNPEGKLTVMAHITRRAALPELRAALEALDGWNESSHRPDGGYHHGTAPDVAAALARCLRFAPPGK